ncbi:muconolactone Delta-isomerase family protein [Aquibium sp. A9E412]|uniref:muconolactone Delta-isomerase n=1 Tax=Aquibium sp. A9E412 TaxID=2976767 RepID=UPI0025B25B87|nr:muconolactone Delta-isomerase family protein [Aquibium sp. A9E412]MDN2565067.1 muconolactone Delta-isomerase family protein [Aquibium sp. A9E412]
MEFLVNITLRWSDDMDPELKERIIVDERAHAAELAQKGHLVRMWRVPGRFENWGVWRARDATELHEILSGMPAFPWMVRVDVHPLARHAVDPAPYPA